MGALKDYNPRQGPGYNQSPDYAVGVQGLRMLHVIYDFAVDGGAQGLITLKNAGLIPDNAILYGGVVNAPTAPLSLGSATISLGTSAGSSATALKTATAIATYSVDSILALVPVMTAGSAVKMTASGYPTLTIATADLTAGVLEIFIIYLPARN